MGDGSRTKHGPVRAASYYPSFIGELASGKPVPIPEGERWSDTIKRISVRGRIAEIDEEAYWHFLEVLPPRFLLGHFFAFAEGMAPLLVFWRCGAQYYCRQLSWRETGKFCRQARLPEDYWAY